MTRAWAWLGAVLVVAASPGCSDRACMQWGEADGACPTADEALTFMRGGASIETCGMVRVVSVDSEGDFDGQACCYDITESEEESFDGDIACDVGVGAGPAPGAGPSVAVTSGSTSSGFCGDGFCDSSIGETCDSCPDCGSCGCDLGTDGCVGCGEVAAFPECTESDLCRGSHQIFDAVIACACGSCTECQANLCSGSFGTADAPCTDCLLSTCPTEVDVCVNDVSD